MFLCKSQEFIISKKLCTPFNCSLPWLCKRQIKVAALYIADEMDPMVVSNYFQEFGRYIRDVTFTDYSAPGDFLIVANHCHRLRSLKCASIVVVEHFELLYHNNSDLRWIHLGGLNDLSNVNIQDISLPNLHTITLNNCQFEDSFALQLTSLSREICWLDLYFCEELSEAAILSMVQNCPKLTGLGLGGLQVSDAVLEKITKLCPGMTNLILYGNELITDRGILSIASNLQTLEEFDIQACIRLTDLSLSYLSTYCASTLRVLYIGEHVTFGFPATRAMLAACSNIRTFVWSVARSVMYDAVTLAPLVALLSQVDTLLLGEGMATDTALLLVAQHCRELRQLNLFREGPTENAFGEPAQVEELPVAGNNDEGIGGMDVADVDMGGVDVFNEDIGGVDVADVDMGEGDGQMGDDNGNGNGNGLGIGGGNVGIVGGIGDEFGDGFGGIQPDTVGTRVEVAYTATGVFAVATQCRKLQLVVARYGDVINPLCRLFWQYVNPLVTFSQDDQPFCSSLVRDLLY